MVTIEDVAKAAGVSVATVSRVINSSSRARPETAQKVLKAIKQLNYVPNQSARNLRRNESHVILALAPNFSNPYYSRILEGIGETSRAMGYSVLICTTGSDETREKHFLEMLKNHRADGAIFLGCRKNSFWLREYVEQYPIVQCCEYVSQMDCPSITVDNYVAALEMVFYMKKLGHRRIAMIGSENKLISTQLRREGYLDALKQSGLEYRESYYAEADMDYSFASGRRAAEKLLRQKDRPTAIFCISDIIALSVISVAQEMGLRVPQDLTVTGFDDVDYTTMFHPYLTTVAQPCYEMGQQSTELLLAKIRGDAHYTGRFHVPFRFVERESSAPPEVSPGENKL